MTEYDWYQGGNEMVEIAAFRLQLKGKWINNKEDVNDWVNRAWDRAFLSIGINKYPELCPVYSS